MLQGLLPAAALLLSGCASPGVPRPPSLGLPVPVRDLTAIRSGDAVRVAFSAARETTDHQALPSRGGSLAAVLCRFDAGPCVPLQRLAVLPGNRYEWTDQLPPALLQGALRPIAYRVTLQNRRGRDAGPSRPALAAAGQAPPPVTGLAATTTAAGVLLTWNQADESPMRVEARTNAAGQAAPQVHLLESKRAPGEGDAGGAVDAAPDVGQQVTYRAYRVHTGVVDGVTLILQGAPAEITAVRGPDRFAPAAPAGLLAIAVAGTGGSAEVDLSWEANEEPDLAGYWIYRASAGVAFQRLNAKPAMGISYADTVPGVAERFVYAVAAVDHAGNEGPRSTPVAVNVRP